MKKNYLLMLFLTTLLSLSSSEYVMAATGLSKAEEMILEKIKGGAEIDGEVRNIPVSYMNQIENEFIKNEVDITDEQAEVIIGKVEEALDIINSMSIRELSNLQDTDAVLKLLALVDEAATEVDYKVSINLSSMSINIINSEGDTVFIANNSINQTGINMLPSITLGLIFLGALFACLITSIKFRLYRKRTAKYQLCNTRNKEGLGTGYEA